MKRQTLALPTAGSLCRWSIRQPLSVRARQMKTASVSLDVRSHLATAIRCMLIARCSSATFKSLMIDCLRLNRQPHYKPHRLTRSDEPVALFGSLIYGAPASEFGWRLPAKKCVLIADVRNYRSRQRFIWPLSRLKKNRVHQARPHGQADVDFRAATPSLNSASCLWRCCR